MTNYEQLDRELDSFLAETFITCSNCGKPCGIIHDLDRSDCCAAQIVVPVKKEENLKGIEPNVIAEAGQVESLLGNDQD